MGRNKTTNGWRVGRFIDNITIIREHGGTSSRAISLFRCVDYYFQLAKDLVFRINIHGDSGADSLQYRRTVVTGVRCTYRNNHSKWILSSQRFRSTSSMEFPNCSRGQAGYERSVSKKMYSLKCKSCTVNQITFSDRQPRTLFPNETVRIQFQKKCAKQNLNRCLTRMMYVPVICLMITIQLYKLYRLHHRNCTMIRTHNYWDYTDI